MQQKIVIHKFDHIKKFENILTFLRRKKYMLTY